MVRGEKALHSCKGKGLGGEPGGHQGDLVPREKRGMGRLRQRGKSYCLQAHGTERKGTAEEDSAGMPRKRYFLSGRGSKKGGAA